MFSGPLMLFTPSLASLFSQGSQSQLCDEILMVDHVPCLGKTIRDHVFRSQLLQVEMTVIGQLYDAFELDINMPCTGQLFSG